MTDYLEFIEFKIQFSVICSEEIGYEGAGPLGVVFAAFVG